MKRAEYLADVAKTRAPKLTHAEREAGRKARFDARYKAACEADAIMRNEAWANLSIDARAAYLLLVFELTERGIVYCSFPDLTEIQMVLGLSGAEAWNAVNELVDSGHAAFIERRFGCTFAFAWEADTRWVDTRQARPALFLVRAPVLP